MNAPGAPFQRPIVFCACMQQKGGIRYLIVTFRDALEALDLSALRSRFHRTVRLWIGGYTTWERNRILPDDEHDSDYTEGNK